MFLPGIVYDLFYCIVLGSSLVLLCCFVPGIVLDLFEGRILYIRIIDFASPLMLRGSGSTHLRALTPSLLQEVAEETLDQTVQDID